MTTGKQTLRYRDEKSHRPMIELGETTITNQTTLLDNPSQAAGVALAAKPSLAAYGESANIWGSNTSTSGMYTNAKTKVTTRIATRIP